MKFKLTDRGPRLDEKKLAAFEARRRLSLPPEYRRFLLRANGGVPDPDVSFAFVERGRPADSVLDCFYMLKAGADEPSLDEAIETFVLPGRVPPHLLPVAADQFGNQLCLSLAPADFGAVYFWNHEREPEAPPAGGALPAFDNLSRVADGFEAFLALLTPVEG